MAKKPRNVSASAVGDRASLASAGHSSSGSGASEGVPALPTDGAEAQAQMFRSLADHSQEFIGMCDLEFKPFYVNEAGRRLVGLNSTEEACAVRLQDFFFPEDQRFINEDFFPKVLSEGAGEVEIRLRHFQTGAALWVTCNVFQLRDGRGRVSGYATVSRDITERKRREADLREREARLRGAIGISTVGVIFWRNYRLSEVNDAFQRMTGFSREEVLGKSWEELTPPEFHAISRRGLEELAARGEISPFEKEYYRKDGSRWWGLFTARDLGDVVAEFVVDITGQKGAEQALRESEEKYRVLFQSIDQGFCTVEVLFDREKRPIDYRFLMVNPAFERQTGIPNAVGRRMREIAPLHEEHWFQIYGRIALTGEPQRFENVAEQLHRIYDVYAWRVGEPKENRVAVLFNDITERRRTEEALREGQERLHLACAAAEVGMWDWDPQTGRAVWSPEHYRIFGVDERNFVPTTESINQLVHPEDRAVFWKRVRRDLGDKRFYENEFRIIRPDGQVRWLRSVGRARSDREGKPVRLIGVVMDITERKRAEEALRRSQAWLARGVEVSGLGLFDHDQEQDVIEWSAELREMLGLQATGAVTLGQFLERVTKEDRPGLVEAIRRAHDPAGDGRFEVEYRVRDGSGRVRWMSVRSQTSFEGEGAGRHPVRTIGAVLDVTERKERQAALERLVAERTARLQELVAELEHFSYTITHDLKSPLRAMRGFAEMAAMANEADDPRRVNEFLGRISTSAERMDHLIADALNYSRAVRQELPLQDVDFAALLRGILDSYPEFQPSRATIRVEGHLPVVLANPAGLTQCFSNLLGNSVKFVKPGEKPEIRVWASEVPAHGVVRIWVEDKSIGISKEMLPRVFDMFARASKDYEGTGIGLALVRKVAHRMGGKVGVESEEGKGSRFWIELKSAERKLDFGKTAVVAPVTEAQGTVLYVEDEESDAMFMAMGFEAKGVEGKLRLVKDGRAAIDYLSGSGEFGDREKYPVPTLVLLDLNLPQVSGFAVLEWIRNHPDYARLPVVVFSSSTRDDDQVKAKELGADEFVAKPSSGLRFGEVVERLQEKWLR